MSVSEGRHGVAKWFVRTPGGLREVKTAMIRTANGLKTFYSSLLVNTNPSFVSGSANSTSNVTIVTDSSTMSGVGGVEPYSYSWTTPNANWDAINPNSATSSFRRTNVAPSMSSTAIFTAHITDATGTTATATVTATVKNVSTA